jgi:hypothetical protein
MLMMFSIAMMKRMMWCNDNDADDDDDQGKNDNDHENDDGDVVDSNDGGWCDVMIMMLTMTVRMMMMRFITMMMSMSRLEEVDLLTDLPESLREMQEELLQVLLT